MLLMFVIVVILWYWWLFNCLSTPTVVTILISTSCANISLLNRTNIELNQS